MQTFSARVRIRTTQKVHTLRWLALYLRSGIPIRESLSLMVRESRRDAQTRLLTQVRNDIDVGRTLSESLGRFPYAYHSLELNIISIGETTGTLPTSLERASEILKMQSSLKQRLLSALLYPTCILLGTISVSLFLLIFAFPKIVPLLTTMGADLPLPTRIIIGTSDLIQAKGLLIVLSTSILVGITLSVSRWNRARRVIQFSMLRVPLLGASLRLYYVANISKLLSVLLRSGVRVEAAIAQVRSGILFIPYEVMLRALEEGTAQGHRLSDQLRNYPLLFSRTSIEIISAGEITGTLSDSFLAAADVCEEELSELTDRLSSLLEPILMVGMGAVVGFIALAIILPMYSLTQNISLP